MNRREIFVFGSNLSGIHGAGAAAHAHQHLGAEWGVGVGLTGECYALPTKGHKIEFIPFDEVKPYLKEFIDFATDHQELLFLLTPVGTGLAGFTREQVLGALLEHRIPSNVVFTSTWFQE